MPRVARLKSSTSVYHIIIRGINRQNIFQDNEDMLEYLKVLKKYKGVSGFEIYAYCLMNNHIHLLIKVIIEDVSIIMKRIGSKYVYWFNKKYERTGHLFQDRFRSEPVEDDAYLLTVLRYIHQNPLKAGIVDTLDEYRWSSYCDYIRQDNSLTDTAFILNIFSHDTDRSLPIFKDIMNQLNDDKCLDDDMGRKQKITDEEVKAIFKQLTNFDDPQKLQFSEKKYRNEIIRKLKKTGASIRQLERITGVGKKIIESN